MRRSRILKIILAVLILALIGGSVRIADFIIEYNWWREVGQVSTWLSMLAYAIAPTAIGAVIAFVALWIAHSQGIRFAGYKGHEHRLYSRLIPVALAIIAVLFSSAAVDYWNVMRFVGSLRIAGSADSWRDPVFGHPLGFYLFNVPFYSDLLGFYSDERSLTPGIVVLAPVGPDDPR